jgi:hypothetical protein
MIPKVPVNCAVVTKGLKVATLSNVLHSLMELEYAMPPCPNVESYYAIFCLQNCLRLGITPPMIGASVSELNFLALWAMEDLEL